MDITVTALALGAAACLGLSLVLTQLGLRRLPPLRGACISVPTTALAYLLLAVPMLDTSGFKAHSALLFAVSGCLFPAAVTLLTFEANRRVGPAITGALGNLTPLFAVLGAIALLGEVPRAGQLAGMGVILAGVALIIGTPQRIPVQGFAWAIGLLLAAAVIRGSVQPLIKLGLAGWPNPFAASLISYIMSASVILTTGTLREGRAILPVRGSGWPWFVPVGLLNGFSVLLMYAALARGPVAVVAPLVACYPLATLAFSRLLLGAGGLSAAAGVGVAVTVAGVALLLRA
ncbi:MAG TPA: DMT family transporter [Hyphomicrobiaceae bacterium]|nr:DMT family transporter [Hyphomicrobiaceae bacterium]